MRILLTNDDGIFSPGLLALWSLLSETAEVTVVAPEAEQSCCAHGITLNRPVMCHRIERDGVFFGYGLDGTPADCVKIALAELMPEKPDLIVSGINPAGNAGTYVLYSGTVAAAVEGTMAGVRSVAVSISHRPGTHGQSGPDFVRAADLVMPIIQKIQGLPESVGLAFNINLPADLGPVRGVKVARQSCLAPAEVYVRRSDPRGRLYFWIGGDKSHHMTFEPDSDRTALAEGWITVTPLRCDLTNEQVLQKLSEVDWTQGPQDSSGSVVQP